MSVTLEQFIAKLKKEGRMEIVKKKVSSHLEAAKIMHSLEGKPVYFENVDVSKFSVIGNLFCTRELVAEYLGCEKEELVQRMLKAIEKPAKPKEVKTAAFLENEADDLNGLPLLFHYPQDGGEYITSGVVIAQDEKYGRNCSFHRMMKIGKDKLVARILERHLN